MSKLALHRAGSIADGWVAQSSMDSISEEEMAGSIAVIGAAAREAGRTDRPRIAVRLPGVEGKEQELARRLTSLADAGIDELIIDVDWNAPDGPARTLDALRTAAA
jgi:alkanesulfonate monooxygenase SsuD/methylene tetrahydromethanopterin reductase-like flavin-dependent oxidoreductase (luciferase family)